MATLSERQCDFTEAVARLILKAIELGYSIKVSEWNRTVATEIEYIAKGLSKLKDPNSCRHVQLLAVDIVLFNGGKAILEGEAFRPLGEYWESLGGRWGGRFGLEDQPKSVQDEKLGWDVVHMEFHP